MASGGWFHPPHPPVARFFREKYRHFICIWFFDLVTKILFANFYKNFHGSSGPRELSRDLFSTVGKRKFAIFEVFRAHLSEFSILFHEIYMVARSYQVLAADIKRWLISALVGLETRLKVPILAIFWRFMAFFKLSVLAEAFELGQWFFYENLV